MKLPIEAYKNPGLSAEQRASDLLSRMTWEEKLGQMMGYCGAAWSADRLENYLYGVGQVSFFGGVEKKSIYDSAAWQRDVQKRIMEKSRFGIPAIFHLETLCGAMLPDATIFPSGIGQAAGFDPEQQRNMGSLVGKQGRAAGAHQAFSPVLDVARDPRFGRMGETGGEDPTLISALGCAIVNGIQQNGNLKEGMAATAKHFLGYHDSQGGIHAAACDIPDRLLREVYAKPFQAAISKAGMRGIMPSYSSIDGEPVSASKKILTGLLEEEMGFDGVVVSDYSAVEEIHTRHCAAENLSEAGRKAILAGVHQELPSGNCYQPEIMKDIQDDPDVETAVDKAVLRILRLKFELGLFENPYASGDETIRQVFESPRNHDVAMKSALQSLVLLKNNGVLPLSGNEKRVAVIGWHAESVSGMFGGYTWLSTIESSLSARNTMAGVKKHEDSNAQTKKVWSGSLVEKNDPQTEVDLRALSTKFRSLLDILKEKHPNTIFYNAFGYPYVGDDCSSHSKAIEVASEADLIIMTIGGKYSTGSTASVGEGIDGTNINLPSCQESLIWKLKKLGKPLILIHFDGRPISSDAADACADALLEAWNPGQAGPEAVEAAIYGSYIPGGRMPVSTPYNAGQIPIYYNHPNGSSYHQNTITAFRSYVDCPHEPRYCFGYGLSYTSFEYSDLWVHIDDSLGKDCIKISFVVKNTGSIAGDEVAQLYIRDCYASMVRPVQELAGFTRIHLTPGEKNRITFTLHISQFAFLDSEMQWKVEKGDVQLMIGASAMDIRLSQTYHIEEDLTFSGMNRAFFSDCLCVPE